MAAVHELNVVFSMMYILGKRVPQIHNFVRPKCVPANGHLAFSGRKVNMHM